MFTTTEGTDKIGSLYHLETVGFPKLSMIGGMELYWIRKQIVKDKNV